LIRFVQWRTGFIRRMGHVDDGTLGRVLAALREVFEE
jgi:hypothetical protein